MALAVDCRTNVGLRTPPTWLLTDQVERVEIGRQQHRRVEARFHHRRRDRLFAASTEQTQQQPLDQDSLSALHVTAPARCVPFFVLAANTVKVAAGARVHPPRRRRPAARARPARRATARAPRIV